MSNYIVGDIQGCFDELQLLLDRVAFNPEQDTLWVAGDLVARGPKSLETLRFIRQLGTSAKVVLGNHDLHLLAVARGIHPIKKKDKTLPILEAEDGPALLEWIRQQPLLQEHDEFVLAHAGISPLWDLPTARSTAREIETLLQSERWGWLIENMYSNQPDHWNDEFSGIERYRYIINSYTRMRFCFADGRLDMKCKLPRMRSPMAAWCLGLHCKTVLHLIKPWCLVTGQLWKAIAVVTSSAWIQAVYGAAH